MPTLAIDSLPDDEAIARAENRSIRAFRAHRARYPQKALDALDNYGLALARAINKPEVMPAQLVQLVLAAVKVIEQQRVLLRIPGPPKESSIGEKKANAIPSVMDDLGTVASAGSVNGITISIAPENSP